MTLKQLANILNLDYTGNDFEITGLNTLKEADENEISFLENQKYANDLADTKAKAVFIREEFVSLLPTTTVALTSKNPYLSLALASKYFANPPFSESGAEPQIAASAKIQKGAYIGYGTKIGENVQIFAGVHIGEEAAVGDNTIIYPNAVIYRNCTVGANCILHAGCVIGSDGFGFAHTATGEHVKIYQNGVAIIEDDCEIGANTTIDRAVFGKTVIKKGVKMDNLVQIGHNCEIGEYSIIVSQTGIAGSTKLGRNVIMGGQSAVAGHVVIGDFATVAARGAIVKSIAGNAIYSGAPAMEHKKWLKLQAKLALMVK
ncbi:MAG: hypothetical protein RL154_1129 [Pseudomonadota bacterium]